ncbi:hypothetical protein J1N35_022231 [Gossypium stocksii]|uniref:Uncharacterized protein n=1 Tax=Gossypium stocksii TaxID=47602 RepID=A0A9D3VG26_9ROSI|nr:hypothetical protein J1N35_022231 [Gossypium stocksii]
MKEGVILVKFGNVEDRKKTLNLSPRLFDQYLFAMLPYVKGKEIGSLRFQFISILGTVNQDRGNWRNEIEVIKAQRIGISERKGNLLGNTVLKDLGEPNIVMFMENQVAKRRGKERAVESNSKKAPVEQFEENLWMVHHLLRRRLAISPAKINEVFKLELSWVGESRDSLGA